MRSTSSSGSEPGPISGVSLGDAMIGVSGTNGSTATDDGRGARTPPVLAADEPATNSDGSGVSSVVAGSSTPMLEVPDARSGETAGRSARRSSSVRALDELGAKGDVGAGMLTTEDAESTSIVAGEVVVTSQGQWGDK